MNNNNLLLSFDKDLRVHIMYPEARREVTSDIVRFIRGNEGSNVVLFSFSDETALDETITRQIDYFRPTHAPFDWTVYEHDLPRCLPKRLIDRGFEIEAEPAALMLLDMDHAPNISVPPEIDIRRINSDRLEDITLVLKSVYGYPADWVYERMGLHLQIPGYLSIFAAYVNELPVSIAWVYFPHGRFARLFGGTTLAEFRNRGLYSALLHVRLNEIRRRGYHYAVVECGSMSKPIVAKNGFQQISTVCDYTFNGMFY